MVEETIDFIDKEAGSYGIKPQTHIVTEPIVFSNYDSIKVRLISRTHKFNEFKYPMITALCETWNPDYVNKFVRRPIKEQIFLLKKAYKEHRTEQFMENIRLVFRIDGVPRYMTHQIVRHREMSFSQESFRVVDIRNHGFRIPTKIVELSKTSRDILNNYKNAIIQSREVYIKLIEKGVPPEEARAVMPMATLTSLTMSTNLNSFIRYYRFRGDAKGLAQSEHQFIANELWNEFKIKEKDLYELVV